MLFQSTERHVSESRVLTQTLLFLLFLWLCFDVVSCISLAGFVFLAFADFLLISFWLTCSHSLCLCMCSQKPALFHGSSSPVEDIFVLCVGECYADVRQIGGCRRRVRIKEDVAASSKPHETVFSFLLIFRLILGGGDTGVRLTSGQRITRFIVVAQPGSVCIFMWPGGCF